MSAPTTAESAVYAEELRALATFRRSQADLYEHLAVEAEAGATTETDENSRLQQVVLDAAGKLPERFRRLAKDV
jgi:hypothetical protein